MLPWIFLGGLAILVLVLGGTFLWHLFLGVPYVPTPQKVVEKMVEMADLRPGDVVFDLGAGDGRFLLEAKKRCPQITAIGYELVPAVWLSGWLKTRRIDPSIQFLLGDARKVDVSRATVVFLYVAPHLMSILEKRFQQMLRPGTRIVSYTFKLPHRSPSAFAGLTSTERPMIYVYTW